ncbi:hypothetical protein BOX15_Mlig018317g4 [Macrostomum lignano]|uniref:U2A'/phosphoprotein 32 family A C-terminal domain-containing protein n=1 Tax=Macrostomum lignano TaxID=282301 RepID=A0A267GEB3_9PLAT|nr:hypothetical protein BOX15_Mlig018317g4 [Macrostomum lignano]
MEHILEANPALHQKLQNQMKSQHVMRLFEVEELYLGKLSLGTIPSLHCFPNLQAVWLNGNRLLKVDCLKDNLRLGDLYLHNNKLISISGSLGQLTGLKTLLLHNNQLSKVEEVVQELKNMQGLQTLTLFDNPVAQEKHYRDYVIFHLPSVKVLDRHEITFNERMRAQRLFDTDNQLVRDRLAFGSRVETRGCPADTSAGAAKAIKQDGGGKAEIDRSMIPQQTFDSIEAAYEQRRQRKTPMEFTYFDWSRVPRYQQRRTQSDSKDIMVNQLQRVTVRYQV